MANFESHRFEYIITDHPSFESVINSTKPQTIKWGADPSAPDLHLGHAVILNQLSRLQQMGHHVHFVIGDFTARIGDPTGKSSTRPALTEAEVKSNATTYLSQVFKCLDESKTTVHYNSEWLNTLSPTDIISLCAKVTVARMLERDDFSKRFKGNTPIGIHEFLYPLLQGYDSVHLKNDIEIGGTDQTFNLLMGRHLQKEAGLRPQSVLTMPILEGLDGTQKMSKSLNNHIAILDSPNDMFGKCMSIPDTLIIRYLSLITHASPTDIQATKQQLDEGINPRTVKLDLATRIVSTFHCASDATSARDNFINVFSNHAIPNDVPELSIQNQDPLPILQFMCDQHLAPSKKEARRLIDQGAVSINNTRIQDPNHQFIPEPNTIIKVGKRKFLKITP
ncbi:MAG: tyrosine--tRNA ligase [Candidatus Margulisbacteria bacterium]|nr:tyrosine--tRNA ligase [Candidatus Margulisiibacteriota bacterium]